MPMKTRSITRVTLTKSSDHLNQRNFSSSIPPNVEDLIDTQNKPSSFSKSRITKSLQNSVGIQQSQEILAVESTFSILQTEKANSDAHLKSDVSHGSKGDRDGISTTRKRCSNDVGNGENYLTEGVNSPIAAPKQTKGSSTAFKRESVDTNNDATTLLSQDDKLYPIVSTPKKKQKANPRAVSPSTSSSRKKRERIPPNSRPAPKDFVKIYSLIQELRKDKSAPCDMEGAEALPETEHGKIVYRFQTLIALMLSSQTKDAVVGEAMRNLQKHGLDVENINRTPNDKLNDMIQKVGFRNNKTKYIKSTCEIIIREYDGDIPTTADELMKLPGVGPKMAYIIESIAWGRNSGIGVDTHMHRLFNQLKWVKSKTPEQTREQLESFLPREYWPGVNLLWVGFGQETQQQKEKIIKKCIACSRPVEAFGLLRKLNIDYMKEAKKYGLEEDVKDALKG